MSREVCKEYADSVVRIPGIKKRLEIKKPIEVTGTMSRGEGVERNREGWENGTGNEGWTVGSEPV